MTSAAVFQMYQQQKCIVFELSSQLSRISLKKRVGDCVYLFVKEKFHLLGHLVKYRLYHSIIQNNFVC